MSKRIESVKKWFDDHRKEILENFKQFLSFKSISTDVTYKKDVLDCLVWMNAHLEACGLTTEIWETQGYPVLFARYDVSPDRPTVLLYHHYDVQPVDPIELWEFDPFSPYERDGCIYARGAQDNKGQCFYSITALQAFIEEQGDVNIKVIIEGEEEIGSSGLSMILPEKREALRADHLLVIDTDIPGPDTPSVVLGVRGIVHVNIALRGSENDLHSGVYGGLAYNPNRALAELLAKCWNENGHVSIPGFYDGIEELGDDEKSQLNFDIEPDMSTIFSMGHEEGYSLVESNWIRPTLEINGMSGGYSGEGVKTVIPAEARAKLSIRTVPGQDPERLLTCISEFVKQNAAEGMDVQVKHGVGIPSIRTRADSKTVRIVTKAFEKVFGKECKKVLWGASVPITRELAEASGASFILMGLGLGSDRIHAPNERFGLDRFEKGFLVVSEIIRQL